MFESIVDFIRKQYKTEAFIPLHEPRFTGNEKEYLAECIDTTYVSSVGKFVDDFEAGIANYTGSAYAVAMANGTLALHLALKLLGTGRGDAVITQPLTFIATANSIAYTGAVPVFVDVDRETMGMSPDALEAFLDEHAAVDKGICVVAETGQPIRACLPMHSFGHPVRINRIIEICDRYGIPVIEDAAESIGSLFEGKHTGVFGKAGILSFNGNKTITTGGGGMLITNDADLAKRAKHLSTQAKVPHPWEFMHDEVGYNYRMPNINAALGMAQLEQLDRFIQRKRELASRYKAFFTDQDVRFFTEPAGARSNYWLNAIFFRDRAERDAFLQFSNDHGVMTRPAWALMTDLPMYRNALTLEIPNARWIYDCMVNIPSSVIV